MVKPCLSILSLATLILVGCGGGGSTTDAPPEFTSMRTKKVLEGTIDVLTVKAVDDSALRYSIVGGADQDKFHIDAQSGLLRFKTAPDFENPADADHNNHYVVMIQAQEEDQAAKTATITLTITVTNDTTDDGPEFSTPDHISLRENRQLDFTVAANGAMHYRLSGEDQNRFILDTQSGKLRFVHFLPDFERPSDANRDNVYTIYVTATDDQNYSSRQVLQITITNDTSDDAAEANWVPIYKTGADDGIVSGDTFGADRNFTTKRISGDSIVVVGQRMWEDSAYNENANYDYFEAVNYCTNLHYGGYGDWRLPNRHELYEIVNYGKSHTGMPTIDDVFQHSTTGNYWTSENVIGHSGNVLSNFAFVVWFRDGASYPLDRGTKQAVRCVRGEKLTYTQTVQKDADDIYRDSNTGLMWAKPAGPESMVSAKNRCSELIFGGYDDWRLPNISELHTIMPSVVEERGYPYGAKPLLQDAATQLWSATMLNNTMGRYLDNYWNTGAWGDNDTVPVDDTHPLGRDVQNDANIEADNANSVFSLCVRGGRL